MSWNLRREEDGIALNALTWNKKSLTVPNSGHP